jgi:outer membrane protein OmpA-like peptidoglycan-associated protein
MRRNERSRRLRLLIAGLVGLLTLPVAAQELSVEDIVQQLTPAPVTRDVRGVAVTPTNTPAPSVSIRVQFAYDSTELNTETLLALKNLGNALGDPRLAALRFQIIGHTDAVGSEAYNQDLSYRRAMAVLDHMAFYYDLDRARFVAMGLGETQLFNPAAPESGENRRVEVRSFIAE